MKKLSQLLLERIDKMRHAWDDDVTNNHHFIDGEEIDPTIKALAKLVDAVEGVVELRSDGEYYCGDCGSNADGMGPGHIVHFHDCKSNSALTELRQVLMEGK